MTDALFFGDDFGGAWRRAAAYAARAHEHQNRRDGRTPYVAHPARVAMTVAATFACRDGEAITIAFLHDVIEDCGKDYEDMLEDFGPVVADAVAALSKDASLPSAEREAAYDRGLAAAGWRAKLVKLADVLDNMSDSGAEPTDARRRRLTDRAERAIAIARADDGGHETLARAADTVADALRRFKA
jgi:guanosine-3',5'-bis(diphosphate) 3'-pyrophosphohydrolase